MLEADNEHGLTVILTDFDHTLFDAATFKEVLKAAVCSSLGMQDQAYDEAYKHVRTVLHRGFSEEAFAEACEATGSALSGVQRRILHDVLQDLGHDTAPFLYDDVAQFLRLAKTWDARPVIVSFGDAEFQHLKLHGTGTEAFLPDVRFVEQPGDIKDEMIDQAVADYPNARFVYIEDRGDLLDRAKKHYPKMVAIRMARPGAAYEKLESELADHRITSFQPLPRLLASCLSCGQNHAPNDPHPQESA